MFDANKFEHYLTYGATDQHTVRELAGRFSGLLVPGTVAAFQREGTGGFVLTLSATQAGTPYVIDPRFPLFQQPLSAPKKSHEALADIVGEPGLVSATGPHLEMFTSPMIDTIARRWAEFNATYKDSTTEKFDKYAKRLNEPVAPHHARGPKYILPPYTMAAGPTDPWWSVACKLFDGTLAHVGDPAACIRVVAAKDTKALGPLLMDAKSARVAVWVSGLNEFHLPAPVLAEYARAVREARAAGMQLFALYGGFFSVLLSSVGLGGSCHGIGFGEYRDWLELPQSGPPPARYYLPLLHRYISPELAFQMWVADAELAQCDCEVCDGQPPVELEYHSLMKHSVLCRAKEIDEWVGLSPTAVSSRLTTERRDFLARLNRSSASDLVKAEASRSTNHLQAWIDAFTSL